MLRKSTAMTALAISLTALSACTTGNATVAEATPPAPPSMAPGCGADQLGAYIGQPASDEVIAAITQWRGDKPMRVLRPGQPMTMDFRPDRLNVQIGEDGKIKGFNCA
ncbi:I78 family peptidase inhibitor [Sphingomonas sp. IC081]|uniref:I78 family peptidase inhibitor n=1 Tax=Sphingomonas sp. IC081 TaxID=304378 RepID=UPI00163CD3C1|nr:I78 family peptidase inhibitor [Sphingomonas sp. IC081]